MSKLEKREEPITLDPAQVEQAEHLLEAVNLDEVTNEVIAVKVRVAKTVEVLDDEGNPLLDEEGNPLKSRTFTTRTARILNFVPVPVYHEAMKLRNQLQGSDIEAQLETMTDLVLKVWKQTEPWMSKEQLQEGLDFLSIGALFRRFFNASRLLGSKATVDGSSTNGTSPKQTVTAKKR
jgi:hypothetical protein